MKRTKAVGSRSVFNEPGPRGSMEELAAAARPRQCYHRPAGTAFAAYRQGVGHAGPRGLGDGVLAATGTSSLPAMR